MRQVTHRITIFSDYRNNPGNSTDSPVGVFGQLGLKFIINSIFLPEITWVSRQPGMITVAPDTVPGHWSLSSATRWIAYLFWLSKTTSLSTVSPCGVSAHCYIICILHLHPRPFDYQNNLHYNRFALWRICTLGLDHLLLHLHPCPFDFRNNLLIDPFPPCGVFAHWF